MTFNGTNKAYKQEAIKDNPQVQSSCWETLVMTQFPYTIWKNQIYMLQS